MSEEPLDLVRRLGKEFVRRGMRREAAALRLYFIALRAGLVEGPDAQLEAVTWSQRTTEEWLRLLRLPPWENAYPLGTRGTPCRRCKPGKGGLPAAIEEKLWPRGALMRCSGCGWRWLVDDDEEARESSLIVHAARWSGGKR
jgi:hypothetical protein